MLLESITLENFRQFRHESIDFAQGDNGKNVTIIIGENGTGKTTFAQAFFWCMYGETEFSDKNMLNKLVAAEMKPGQESKVQVILKLRHGTVNYTLMREQTYRKDYSNRVKGDNTVFDIAIKDANGNTSYVKKSQCESEVKGILPKELSRYFFFDGERIEKMSKDISTGKKATDFAEAVKGLLGLNAMYSANLFILASLIHPVHPIKIDGLIVRIATYIVIEPEPACRAMAIGIRCSFRNNVIANSLAIAIAGTTFIVSIRRGKCIEEAIISPSITKCSVDPLPSAAFSLTEKRSVANAPLYFESAVPLYQVSLTGLSSFCDGCAIKPVVAASA